MSKKHYDPEMPMSEVIDLINNNNIDVVSILQNHFWQNKFEASNPETKMTLAEKILPLIKEKNESLSRAGQKNYNQLVLVHKNFNLYGCFYDIQKSLLL